MISIMPLKHINFEGFTAFERCFISHSTFECLRARFFPCNQTLVKGEWENPRHFGNLNKLYDLLNTQLLQWFDGARVKHGTLIYCLLSTRHSLHSPAYQIPLNLCAQQIWEYNYKRMSSLKKKSLRRRFVYSRRSSGAKNIFCHRTVQ